jgi:hypothetical protein
MHQRCLWRLAFNAEKCLRQERRATLQLRKQSTTRSSGSNITPCSPSDPTLPPNPCPTPTPPCRDPFTFLAPQLSELRASLLSVLSSGHPAISEITKYYFRHPSKQVRLVIVLRLSQATNGLGGDWDRKLWETHSAGAGGLAEELDKPLTRPDVLNDCRTRLHHLISHSFSNLYGSIEISDQPHHHLNHHQRPIHLPIRYSLRSYASFKL